MLWLEMNLATSVCLLALFSPLTFHVRMLFIVIDGVSPQQFDYYFVKRLLYVLFIILFFYSFLPSYLYLFICVLFIFNFLCLRAKLI